jgi:AcrR family transcriptional regulator
MSVVASRRTFERLPRERRIGDIAEAAQAVFTDCGYESASMSAIAERAGVVEGTIYKYFENKRELLNQVLTTWYQGLLADQAERLPAIAGTRNRLRYVIWHHLNTIKTNPALCRLFFVEVRTASEYHDSPLRHLNRGYTRFATEVLREGIGTGELRPDMPLRLARDVIYGAIEHHAWDYVCGRGDLSVDSVADSLTQIVWLALGRPAGVPTPDATLAERLENVTDRLEVVAAAIKRDSERTP